MQNDTKFFGTHDFMEMEQRYRAAFFNSLGGFKSLNMVGTVDAQGKTNLSIVNSVFHIGANPPYIGMIIRPDKVERHTLENMLETEWYTLNHVHASIYKQAHQASARYDKSVSEFDACGLTPHFSNACIAPYVKESHICIGLKVAEIKPLEINGTVLVIGSVKEVTIPAETLSADGFVDIELAGSLAGSGLDSYHSTKRIARLSYAKPGVEPNEL